MSRQPLPTLVQEPNVVPMIDVLLVLLIIFMITLPAHRRRLDLQLPQQSDGSTPTVSIVLAVEPGPAYTLNGAPVPGADLGAELSRVFRGRRERVLFVRGAPTVRYEEVLHAFDVARGAGVRASGVVLPRP